jgi:hypothetical protein
MQRAPSAFGSNRQRSPAGMVAAVRATIAVTGHRTATTRR